MSLPLISGASRMTASRLHVRSPLLGFVWMYGYISGIGFIVIEVMNLLQGISIRQLLAGNVWIMLGQVCVFMILFVGFAQWRLGRLFRGYTSGQTPRDALSEEDVKRLGNHALQFPSRLFRGFMILAVLLSVSYHVVEWWTAKGTPYAYAWDWGAFAANVSFEQGLSLLVGLVMYSHSRRILRPVIRWLAEGTQLGLGVRMSIRRRIYIVTFSLLVMSSSEYLNLALNMQHGFIVLFLGFMMFFILLTYLFMRSVLVDTVNDIDLVRNRLTAMNHAPAPQFQARLPVESGDELADLKIQFNALQEKAEKWVRQQEVDLALAGRVQMQLIPDETMVDGAVSIRGHLVSQQQVGGDFFDVVGLGDGRIAVLIGDVSGKGMPAALVTATFLGMFRSEVHHGGSTAEVLHRLNGSLTPMLMPGMYVTAGLLYVHGETGVYEYASAGHLPPMHLRDGKVQEWEVGCLPLGFLEDKPMLCHGRLEPGDRLLLYTDGVIEENRSQGDGFERLATWFGTAGQLRRDVHVILDALVEALQTGRAGQEAEDDQTLVAISFGK